jgi:hypothetical protein
MQPAVPPPPLSHPDDVAEMLIWLRERDSNAFPSVPLPDAGTLASWRETATSWGWIPPESRAIVRIGRDARGRFTTGNSGRPRGAKNRITVEVEQMLADLTPDAVKLVGEYVRHDIRTAVWVLENFVRPSGRHVEIANLPTINTAADVPAAVTAIVDEIAKGELCLEDGRALIRVLDNVLGVLETAHRLRGGLVPPPP